jgi:small subunit ribosomal protein S1
VLSGKVRNLTSFGAFVEIEPGIDGLVHVSDMSWTKRVEHPSEVVDKNDDVQVMILDIDSEQKRISLGMKQIEEDPWLSLPAKYPNGTVLTGKVRNLTSFGAFVEIEPGIDGLVHVSDMSWTKRVEHPSEVVDKNDDVQVMILDIDSEQKRISLGIKQLHEDPWPEIVKRFAPGVEPAGKVARIQDKGVVVDLGTTSKGSCRRPTRRSRMRPDCRSISDRASRWTSGSSSRMQRIGASCSR